MGGDTQHDTEIRHPGPSARSRDARICQEASRPMRPPLRIPGPVLPGAHIRVISPASATLAHIPARARRGELALTELGFSVSYGRHAGLISDNGATAGHARQRAADLMEAFEDPSVDAVLSADAGLG